MAFKNIGRAPLYAIVGIPRLMQQNNPRAPSHFENRGIPDCEEAIDTCVVAFRMGNPYEGDIPGINDDKFHYFLLGFKPVVFRHPHWGVLSHRKCLNDSRAA
jgi:hypothetical protein